MENFKIISEELMKQEVKTGIVSGKKFNTVAEEVVGKWCVMIQANNGKIGIGIDVDKNKALEIAINETV